jgi:hypothetical protein
MDVVVGSDVRQKCALLLEKVEGNILKCKTNTHREAVWEALKELCIHALCNKDDFHVQDTLTRCFVYITHEDNNDIAFGLLKDAEEAVRRDISDALVSIMERHFVAERDTTECGDAMKAVVKCVHHISVVCGLTAEHLRCLPAIEHALRVLSCSVSEPDHDLLYHCSWALVYLSTCSEAATLTRAVLPLVKELAFRRSLGSETIMVAWARFIINVGKYFPEVLEESDVSDNMFAVLSTCGGNAGLSCVAVFLSRVSPLKLLDMKHFLEPMVTAMDKCFTLSTMNMSKCLLALKRMASFEECALTLAEHLDTLQHVSKRYSTDVFLNQRFSTLIGNLVECTKR